MLRVTVRLAGDTARVKLSGVLDQTAGAALAVISHELENSPEPVEEVLFDVSDVTAADTAGSEQWLAFQRDLPSDLTLRFSGSPETLAPLFTSAP